MSETPTMATMANYQLPQEAYRPVNPDALFSEVGQEGNQGLLDQALAEARRDEINRLTESLPNTTEKKVSLVEARTEMIKRYRLQHLAQLN